VDQALRAGRQARLEITVAEDASDVQLAHVRAEFAWLAEQGPAVAIARAARCEATRDLVSGRKRKRACGVRWIVRRPCRGRRSRRDKR